MIKTATGEEEANAPALGDLGGEGVLERFIRDFNAYEMEADLFARCKDQTGFAWWDLVRYVVQYALCVEAGTYVAQPAQRRSPPARAVSLSRQVHQMLRDGLRLGGLRDGAVGYIYMFGRRSEGILREIEGSPLPCLVVGKSASVRSRHVVVDKRSIELFVRIASRFIRPSRAMVEAASELNGEIAARFRSRVDVRRIVLDKYAQHRAARIAWRWVLSRTGKVRLVGFIGDDSQKTLVALANAAGIRTREFQHGYMGASHVNYSYPPLPAKPSTLPSEVVLNRDTGDITYPVVRVSSAICTAAVEDRAAGDSRDIDVLIGASPTRTADSFAIADALVGKGLVVAVKLHPNQTIASSGFRDRFTSEQLQVHANDTDFVSLARRSRVYVPANPTSTTVFEAVDSGAKLVVVNYRGVKLTTMTDAVVSRRVDSFELLSDAIRAQLDADAGERHGN